MMEEFEESIFSSVSSYLSEHIQTLNRVYMPRMMCDTSAAHIKSLDNKFLQQQIAISFKSNQNKLPRTNIFTHATIRNDSPSNF